MTDASQSNEGELQPGGTTGAEHDGGAQQVAAESQDAIDEALDGQSPWGADRPIQGEPTDPLAGSGAPTEGAGEAQQAVAADDEGDTAP